MYTYIYTQNKSKQKQSLPNNIIFKTILLSFVRNLNLFIMNVSVKPDL